LVREYREELRSGVADLKNIGGGDAGAITAALFLGEFVTGVPWAHLDIAGPAFSDKDGALAPRGATGYGVRLWVECRRAAAGRGAALRRERESLPDERLRRGARRDLALELRVLQEPEDLADARPRRVTHGEQICAGEEPRRLQLLGTQLGAPP